MYWQRNYRTSRMTVFPRRPASETIATRLLSIVSDTIDEDEVTDAAPPEKIAIHM